MRMGQQAIARTEMKVRKDDVTDTHASSPADIARNTRARIRLRLNFDFMKTPRSRQTERPAFLERGGK